MTRARVESFSDKNIKYYNFLRKNYTSILYIVGSQFLKTSSLLKKDFS